MLKPFFFLPSFLLASAIKCCAFSTDMEGYIHDRRSAFTLFFLPRNLINDLLPFTHIGPQLYHYKHLVYLGDL